MSESTYNTITLGLAIALLIAGGVMLLSLIATMVNWTTPKRRRHLIRLLVAFAAIPCLIAIQQAILWLVFLPSLGRQQMAEVNATRAERLAETSLVNVGDPVPPFSLATVDGVEFALPSNDKVTLINFFATWCGPCQAELPHLDAIWAANKDVEHFRMLIIGREETTESVLQYRNKNGFSFPMAADPDRAVYSLFAKESIPRTVVISPDGRIVYSKAGFLEEDLDELNDVLNEQLANAK